MTYRVLRHPLVKDDLAIIVRLITDYAGAEVALAKLDEIEERMKRLGETPHVGSLRNDIAPGLRAVPAGRKGVIVFRVDNQARAVYVLCVSYGGADWVSRGARRGR